MSDTDDTDVLILIPPDLFLVNSSSDSESSDKSDTLVSELFDHVRSLETRIAVVESSKSLVSPNKKSSAQFRKKRCSMSFSDYSNSLHAGVGYPKKNFPSTRLSQIKSKTNSTSKLYSSMQFLNDKMQSQKFANCNGYKSAIDSSFALSDADFKARSTPYFAPDEVRYENGINGLNNANVNKKEHILDENLPHMEGITKSQSVTSKKEDCNLNVSLTSHKSCPSVLKCPNENLVDTVTLNSEFSRLLSQNKHLENGFSSEEKEDLQCPKPTRLLTLSDFWEDNFNKTPNEVLKIKFEEERFRREHCEQTIQDLQKKILELQEKLAVALRVDNEKTVLISQFQAAWSKLRQKLEDAESEGENLRKILQNISDKHKSEVAEYQEQVKTCKDESSKALNLASGYKEKSDSLVREKLELIQAHDNDIETFKSKLEEIEDRFKKTKEECHKLLEEKQQADEALKALQQELHKERLKSGEVRSEMGVIHKALDSCEAELTILRQEKESLQLKLKEEMNRNNILTEEKSSLLSALEEGKKMEKIAKNEAKTLRDQQEKIKFELRDLYQKQVDDMVRSKLQEFQSQIDAAEISFQNDLEENKRTVAQIAAQKLKSFNDKYQLEIRLLEEKHKEENRLYEVKLAQANQKLALLESQLNSQQASKDQLVEQLHSVMQNQWQQALKIISGGNGELAPTFAQSPNKRFLECLEASCAEPLKTHVSKNTKDSPNFDQLNETPIANKKESLGELRKYIQTILERRRTSPNTDCFDSAPESDKQKAVDSSIDDSTIWQGVSEKSMLDTSEYPELQKFNFKSNSKQKPPWK